MRFTSSCARSAPLLTASPSDESASAGATLGYSVALKNTDSVGCPASSYALNVAGPSGWTVTSAPSSLTLAPGALGIATVSISAPASAAAAKYGTTVSAIESGVSVHVASAPLSFTVLDTTPPSAPSALALKISQKQKQPQLSWTASADNVAVDGYHVWKNGVMVATTPFTTWMDPGLLAQTDSYWVTAFDPSANVSKASNIVGNTTRTGGKH